MSPRVDATLRAQAIQNPDAAFAVIVRVADDMDARQAHLEADGLAITRRLWLVHGFAGVASGAAICALETHDWIISIEPDRQIRTMDAPK